MKCQLSRLDPGRVIPAVHHTCFGLLERSSAAGVPAMRPCSSSFGPGGLEIVTYYFGQSEQS